MHIRDLWHHFRQAVESKCGRLRQMLAIFFISCTKRRIQRICGLGLVFAMCLAACATDNTKPVMSSEGNVKPRSVTNKDTLVVFIHGFTGDARQTWGDFPRFLHQALSESRPESYKMYSFGYHSSLLTVSPKLDEVVKDLLANLDEYKEAKEIIIIAHSMGGLIAKQYVLSFLGRNDNAGALKVSQIFLIAVPNTGSDLAEIVDSWTPLEKRQVQYLVPNNTWLSTQVKRWQHYVLGEARDAPPGWRKSIRVDAIFAKDDSLVTTNSAMDRFYWATELRRERECNSWWTWTKTYGHTNIVKPRCLKDPVVTEVVERIGHHVENQGSRMPWELDREDRFTYERARVFLDMERWSEARDLLKPLVDKYPKSHEQVHYYYGNALWENGEKEAAIAEYRTAVDIWDKDPSAWFNLAHAYLMQNQTEEAKTAVNNAIERFPQHSEARFYRGFLAFNEAKTYEETLKKATEGTNASAAERAGSEKAWVIAEKDYRYIWDHKLTGFNKAGYFLAQTLLRKTSNSGEGVDEALKIIEKALEEKGNRELFQEICSDAGNQRDKAMYPLRKNNRFKEIMQRYMERSNGVSCSIIESEMPENTTQ